MLQVSLPAFQTAFACPWLGSRRRHRISSFFLLFVLFYDYDYRSVIHSLWFVERNLGHDGQITVRPLVRLTGHECLLRRLPTTETNVGRANAVRYYLTRMERKGKYQKKKGKEIMDNHVIALRQLGSNSLPALLVSVFPGAAPSLLGEDAGEASA